MSIAITNSLGHYGEDEFGIPTLFATQMHWFAQNVIQIIGEEFRQWILKKQLDAQRFKEKSN